MAVWAVKRGREEKLFVFSDAADSTRWVKKKRHSGQSQWKGWGGHFCHPVKTFKLVQKMTCTSMCALKVHCVEFVENGIQYVAYFFICV